jgi:hypothetical protein
MTLSMMTLSVTTFSIMGLFVTLSIMTLSITTFSIVGLLATLSINDPHHDDTKRNDIQHNGLICDTQHK